MNAPNKSAGAKAACARETPAGKAYISNFAPRNCAAADSGGYRKNARRLAGAKAWG
jgi:hypothetical protein